VCDLDTTDEEQLEDADFRDVSALLTGRQTTLPTTVGRVLESVKQLKLSEVAERDGKVSDTCIRSGAGRTEFDTDRTGMTVGNEAIADGAKERCDIFCQCIRSGGGGGTEFDVTKGLTV